MQETKPNADSDFYAGLTKSQIVAIAHKNNTDSTIVFEKKLKSRFSHALPTGVLAIHVKRYAAIRLSGLSQFRGKQGVCLYLRIQVGSQYRDIPTVYVDQGTSEVAVDCIRHFSITVHNNREDATHIKFVLIGYHEFDKQIILAKSDLHIYDILKKPYMSETFEFARKHQVFATADIELSFAYGSFGYGWSNQLQNPVKTPGSQLTHSMFYRQEPPTERLLENAPDIASALPIGHPSFIPFTVKSEIGKTAKDLDMDVDVKALTRTISDPLIVVSKTRKRMRELLGRYGSLTSRKERMAFLNKLVNERSASDYQREKMTMEQHKDIAGTGPNTRNSLAIPNASADSDEDLPTMTLLMANAPAIQPRNVAYRNFASELMDDDHEPTVLLDLIEEAGPSEPSVVDKTKTAWSKAKSRILGVFEAFGAFGMLSRRSEASGEETVLDPPTHTTATVPVDDLVPMTVKPNKENGKEWNER